MKLLLLLAAVVVLALLALFFFRAAANAGPDGRPAQVMAGGVAAFLAAVFGFVAFLVWGTQL